jgi:hypothetical protein
MTQGKEIREALDTRGLRNVESHMAEWNLSPDTGKLTEAIHRSMTNAAFSAATLSYLQDAPVDRAILYRGDAVLNGMFSATGEPFKKFYVFKAMAMLLDTPERLSAMGGDDSGLTVLAGRSRDRKTIRVLVTNYEIIKDVAPLHPTAVAGTEIAVRLPRRSVEYKNNKGFSLRIQNLPWKSGGYVLRQYRIDEANNLTRVQERSGSGDSADITDMLPPPAVELIEIQKK